MKNFHLIAKRSICLMGEISSVNDCGFTTTMAMQNISRSFFGFKRPQKLNIPKTRSDVENARNTEKELNTNGGKEEIHRQLLEHTQLLDRFYQDKDHFEHHETIVSHLLNSTGFLCYKRQSKIEGAGFGVFVSTKIIGHDGDSAMHHYRIPSGRVLCLYPGSLYEPGEPLFFASMFNKFILRRKDHTFIDGNDRFISKLIHKSCHDRDNATYPFPICDHSWLNFYHHARHYEEGCNILESVSKDHRMFPVRNVFGIGHYINSSDERNEANVMYYEVDFELDKHWPSNLARYIPNVYYNITSDRHVIKSIALISIREIEHGEELLAAYFNEVS